MNKEHVLQTRIELGVLPQIIKDGKAYAALAEVQKNEHKQYVGKYRRMLHDTITKALGVNAPRSNATYRKWFKDPENNVSKALLKNQRRNDHKWLMIVNAMNFALTETLMVAVEETSRHLEFYKERNKHLSSALDSYLKSKDNAV